MPFLVPCPESVEKKSFVECRFKHRFSHVRMGDVTDHFAVYVRFPGGHVIDVFFLNPADSMSGASKSIGGGDEQVNIRRAAPFVARLGIDAQD